MAQYIDKGALVAEIEREINEIKINLDSIDDWRRRVQKEDDIKVMKNILSIINTLEVKEAELNNGFGVYWGEYCDCGGNINDYKVAKHFFELGLKSKKGE